MLTNFNSLYDLMTAFPDEQSCIDHFRAIRWKNGEFCPHCGSGRVYHFKDRKTFKCGHCRERFSIKVGTIFHDTKLPLRKWFMAIWLITNHPKGIASTTLAKDLKVTQKTAWFVLHRLRHAARTKSFNAPLTGIVEVDETYVGGKAVKHGGKSGTRGGSGDKAPVVGAVQRKGRLVAKVLQKANKETLHSFVQETVSPTVTMLVTDELPAYRGLKGFPHETISHKPGGEYVRGEAHTNSIESVWALLKRQIIGIHHWVSAKHLQKYVDEMSWRFNRRGMVVTDRMNDLFSDVEGRLTYKALIA